MAIVKMSKFDLTTFAEDKDALLRRLQLFGDVHITEKDRMVDETERHLNEVDVRLERAEVNERMARLDEAIGLLRSYRQTKTTFLQQFENALPETVFEPDEMTREALLMRADEAEALTQQVLSLQADMRHAEDQLKTDHEQIEELQHWTGLDLSIEEISSPRTVRTWLGTIPVRWSDEVRQRVATEFRHTYVEFIGSDPKLAYLFIMTAGEDGKLPTFLHDINFQQVRFERTEDIATQIDALEEDIRHQEKEIAHYRVQFKRMSEEHLEVLELAYEGASNRLIRLDAMAKSGESRYLSFLEGYVPTEETKEFESAIAEAVGDRYALELKPASVDDPSVPIELKNNKIFEPFESIVSTYALPLYKEMDPTGLIAPWYILFFGIMLGDLGYGALLFLLTTFALKKMHFDPKMQKTLRFFQILSIPTMIAGALFGSVFGGLIPMQPLLIDPTKSSMNMIIGSVVIGFVHIIAGMILKAVQLGREGDYKAIVYDVVSWLLILIGLVIAALTVILRWAPMLKTMGFGMAIVGAVIVLLFSARDEKGGARFAWGAYNLYGATGYIGDIVSYTRLTAIMLAGAYIGFAFNMIGNMLMGIGVPGVVLAVIIMLAAHLFNLFLSALSAYVHSMRLIYVEFFGKFYEGGGLPFKGLRAQPKYRHVVTHKK